MNDPFFGLRERNGLTSLASCFSSLLFHSLLLPLSSQLSLSGSFPYDAASGGGVFFSLEGECGCTIIDPPLAGYLAPEAEIVLVLIGGFGDEGGVELLTLLSVEEGVAPAVETRPARGERANFFSALSETARRREGLSATKNFVREPFPPKISFDC